MAEVVSGLTLDAGALIALERRQHAVIRLVGRARERGTKVTIPASVLAQTVRDPRRQALLSQMLRHRSTRVESLDRVAAVAVGRRLAAAGTADVVDAHVVVTAEARGDAIVTSDPDDINRLVDPGSDVVVIAT